MLNCTNSNNSGAEAQTWDIVHTDLLSADIGSLYSFDANASSVRHCVSSGASNNNNDISSDLTLLVESERFHVHRVILASRSDFFRALLYGGLRESQNNQREIELKGASSEAFKYLLKYIYTGCISLRGLKEETVLDILSLANLYQFMKLKSSISDHLKVILTVSNVCSIFDLALMFNLDQLVNTCCTFIDRKASEVLLTEGFLNLSSMSLEYILVRDSFFAPEVEIFRGVQAWAYHNNISNTNFNNNIMTQLIRLPLMSLDELLNVVRPSKFISSDDILDAINIQHSCRNIDLNFRGFLFAMENVASSHHHAHVIEGDMRTPLLDNNNVTYNLDQGFTTHPIEDVSTHTLPHQPKGITIELGYPCIINSIVMLLWDRDTRSYSYYIETSMDKIEWRMIVDRRRYLCRSKQVLRFKRQVVRLYIRIVGTHNSVNKVFHLVTFECFYNPIPCCLVDGLIVPNTNMATIDNAAWVIEGVSRSRNALINGNMVDYDWDSGYTCHQLGSGAIVVQLAQPFLVNNMRLLLWDCDNRSYSYYIEVSNDQQTWTRVVDRTRIQCRSWQYVFFKDQVVTFIKIVGTQNTANEVFHCVHFECPIEETALLEYNRQQFQQQQLVAAAAATIASSSPTLPSLADQQQQLLSAANVVALANRSVGLFAYMCISVLLSIVVCVMVLFIIIFILIITAKVIIIINITIL
ncbi:hypothetical protein HELRODRAFT_80550 [Helobdella robusta]|uniref:BTB/POZ domain-containing protein 9 n=1 Tax=Helobdella robusta TaxID=6412 RepID=T1G419_HELRO|nr:hypothetical protein HELRODRAFT_80550 [Helobdella robusta]ESO03304.1 hypothetical protein HELRODRAFT_80550 [Helobdella robusta]